MSANDIPDLVNLMEWNRFSEERKTLLEALTILNNRHRDTVAELNQRAFALVAQVEACDKLNRELLLKAREKDAQILGLRKLHEATFNLAAGWDEDGATDPKHPLSWESVGRMALDYAKAALSTPPPPVVKLEDVRPLMEALKQISGYSTSSEIETPEEMELINYQHCYDHIVKSSREAVAPFLTTYPQLNS